MGNVSLFGVRSRARGSKLPVTAARFTITIVSQRQLQLHHYRRTGKARKHNPRYRGDHRRETSAVRIVSRPEQ